MDVLEIAPGLWRWTGYHEEWRQDVGCIYAEGDDAVVLVDPLVPPVAREAFLEALDRDVARAGKPLHVLITVFWHGRSARELAQRYGARVWALSSARASVARRTPVSDTFRLGEDLPGSFVAHPSGRGREVALWNPGHRALVLGDVILGAGGGRPLRLCPEGWLSAGRTHADLRRTLAPLSELPVERLLVSHGEPLLARGRGALSKLLRGR